MAFKKFFTSRRGFVTKHDKPYLRFTKHHIILNDEAKEQIGETFNYVVLYFDDETNSIGLWFWKERVLDSYFIGGEKQRLKNYLIINGMRYFEKFGIREKLEEIGRFAFPLVRDEKQKNFYIAALKK